MKPEKLGEPTIELGWVADTLDTSIEVLRNRISRGQSFCAIHPAKRGNRRLVSPLAVYELYTLSLAATADLPLRYVSSAFRSRFYMAAGRDLIARFDRIGVEEFQINDAEIIDLGLQSGELREFCDPDVTRPQFWILPADLSGDAAGHVGRLMVASKKTLSAKLSHFELHLVVNMTNIVEKANKALKEMRSP